jgi:hypothetical protein
MIVFGCRDRAGVEGDAGIGALRVALVGGEWPLVGSGALRSNRPSNLDCMNGHA